MRLFKELILAVFLLTAFGCNQSSDEPKETVQTDNTEAAVGIETSKPVFNLDIKEFKLKNGMLFIVVERPTTPQIACRLSVRTGSALEDSGKTGLAHMLEHMLFKGTENFGTSDIVRDEELQNRIEAAYQIVMKEQRKRTPDPELIKKKLAEMNALREEVQDIYIPHAFSSQLEKNGAVGVNAFTSKDQTQFLTSIPSDMLEQWFSIVSEQLFEPSWREFYVEKDVVQREWAYRYINDPNGASWLDLYATAFNAHPYRNPTIGWKSDMERFNTSSAMDFHKKHYNPNNTVCALVGDLSVEQAKCLAKTYFERYPAGERSPEQVTREPSQQGPRKNIRFLKGARTPLIKIGFHSPRMGTKEFYALDALTSILSLGRSGRMTQNIVEKGLAMEAWAHNPDNRYGDLFILGGSPNEPIEFKSQKFSENEKHPFYIKACEDLEAVFLAEIEKLKTELVTQRELNRIKKLSQRSFLDRMRSNEHLAENLTTLEVQVGWRYMTSYLENLSQVTREEIREAAKKYLVADKRTSIYVIPGGAPDNPPEHYFEDRSAGRSELTKTIEKDLSTNNSSYPTPEAWKHPLSFERKPKKIKYPEAEISKIGDINVFYLQDKELPLIDLYLLVKAGEVDIDHAKTGLADLFNGCIIRGGTEKYSASELALVLDESAIYLNISVARETTLVSLSLMKEDWEKGLALLQEILTVPKFDEAVLNITKQQELSALKRQGGDAQTVCRREATIWHFRDHPYGRDPLLGLEMIPTISSNDLKSFLKKYFVPANMVAAIAGDIDKDRANKSLKGLFEALPNNSAPIRKLDVPAESPPVLALIHKPGQVQSQVCLCLPSVRRTNPSFWKIALLMDIFGGSDSLMYTRLRDDLGLVYAAGFFQTYRWVAGTLVGYIGCKADKTGQAIYETVSIMNKLQKFVSPKNLEQKRLDVLNSFVFNVDTPAQLVQTYATYYMRQEPLNTLENIQDSFMNATKEELEALSRKYVDPTKLQIFVVGDKTTTVKKENDEEVTLEQDLIALATQLGLPYEEIELR